MTDVHVRGWKGWRVVTMAFAAIVGSATAAWGVERRVVTETMTAMERAVPGHGKAGMYLRLTVSRTARLPRYR